MRLLGHLGSRNAGVNELVRTGSSCWKHAIDKGSLLENTIGLLARFLLVACLRENLFG